MPTAFLGCGCGFSCSLSVAGTASLPLAKKTGRGHITITLAAWTRVLAGTQEKRQVHREPI